MSEADLADIPTGMVEVSRSRFFDLMQADPRDIMPRQTERDCTTWEIVKDRVAWGWSRPGWASKSGTPRRYAVIASAIPRERK